MHLGGNCRWVPLTKQSPDMNVTNRLTAFIPQIMPFLHPIRTCFSVTCLTLNKHALLKICKLIYFQNLAIYFPSHAIGKRNRELKNGGDRSSSLDLLHIYLTVCVKR